MKPKNLAVRHDVAKKNFSIFSKRRNIVASNIIPDRVGTVTKHGEARIKGVMKYDLGSGYRLVTYKQDDSLFLLHAGTHDDCHRWIENNRELTVEQIEDRCIAIPVHPPEHEYRLIDGAAYVDEDVFDPMPDISEKKSCAVYLMDS